ncbi:hypothetical protein [Paenibacillus physcomitrellae]|nr:hypothetical protein [Paenibacillus physcomitrellae]
MEIKIHRRRTEQHVLKFIAQNPSRASLYVIENSALVGTKAYAFSQSIL